jgi:hypothetical protein
MRLFTPSFRVRRNSSSIVLYGGFVGNACPLAQENDAAAVQSNTETGSPRDDISQSNTSSWLEFPQYVK